MHAAPSTRADLGQADARTSARQGRWHARSGRSWNRVGIGSLAVAASLAFALVAAYPAPAIACPFCARLGKSLSDAVAEADTVVEGYLEPAKLESGARGSTPLHLIRVMKSPSPAAPGAVVTLSRYLPTSGERRARRIVFANGSGGQIDPYRVLAVQDDRMGEYLAGAVQSASLPPRERYAYFFRYLENANPDIAEDAYKEFAKAPFRAVRAASEHYDPEKLLEWIAEPGTPAYRIGLYGLLVGCAGRGGADLAPRLASWIAANDARLVVGLDGLLAGAVLLDPRGGTRRVLDLLADPDQPFQRRYAALSAVRFILEEMPEVDRGQIVQRLAGALEITDTTDLLVDQLRRAEAFALTERVMALASGASGSRSPPLERAIVRFALAAGDRPSAKAFLARIEAQHPTWIAEETQNLSFEADARRLVESTR